MAHLSTAVSEGVFLYRNGVPPYDGGVFHQAPLLLGLFYPIISSPLLVNFLYVACDLLIGYMLLQITALKDKDSARAERIRQFGNRIEEPGMDGLKVATLYLFNPYTIASCIGRSTILQTNMAVVAGIWMGMRGSWDFVGSVYGTILMVSDLTPNLGLFWYFFIEMFDQFRPFFILVFQIHVFIFAAPISIKLSGNANFFYAIGLVYGIGEIILMIDTTYALARRDFEAQSPPDTSGKDPSHGWDREVVQK
ncbi:hypothetical protein EC968_003536 [Mortierella alpina]|nr:hypothetical protein EC968_003536 [Mortierella alpina]